MQTITGPILRTKGSDFWPAVICRRNGWLPGTVLVADDGYGKTYIQITSIGELSVSAKLLLHNDSQIPEQPESSWDFTKRNWTRG